MQEESLPRLLPAEVGEAAHSAEQLRLPLKDLPAAGPVASPTREFDEKFELLVVGFRQADRNNFVLGKLLVDLCPIGPVGNHNGSGATLKEIARRLREANAEVSEAHLDSLRRVAHKFHVQEFSGTRWRWSWCEQAGTPETLIAAQVAAEQERPRKKLTTDFIKGFLKKRQREAEAADPDAPAPQTEPPLATILERCQLTTVAAWEGPKASYQRLQQHRHRPSHAEIDDLQKRAKVAFEFWKETVAVTIPQLRAPPEMLEAAE